MEEEVKSLLEAGIIRKGSAGTWSAPAFIIKQTLIVGDEATNAQVLINKSLWNYSKMAIRIKTFGRIQNFQETLKVQMVPKLLK